MPACFSISSFLFSTTGPSASGWILTTGPGRGGLELTVPPIPHTVWDLREVLGRPITCPGPTQLLICSRTWENAEPRAHGFLGAAVPGSHVVISPRVSQGGVCRARCFYYPPTSHDTREDKLGLAAQTGTLPRRSCLCPLCIGKGTLISANSSSKKQVSLKKSRARNCGNVPAWPPASRDEPVELGRASQGGLPHAAFVGQLDLQLKLKTDIND